MRDYQVQGLNWMAGLHFNGINGILADEMVSLLPLTSSQLSKLTILLDFLGIGKDSTDYFLPRLSQISQRGQGTSSRYCT